MTLADIQSKVHVGKDKVNSFGGYNYRTAEGILAAIKASLPEGATIVVTDAMQEVAGQIFVSSTATITLADGVAHSASGHAMHPLTKKGMDPSQITGSASSYARKYALSGLVALDDGSADPDSAKEAYAPDVPKFDSAGATSRLVASIGKKQDVAELKAFMADEKQTTDKLTDVDYETVKAVYLEAGKKLSQKGAE